MLHINSRPPFLTSHDGPIAPVLAPTRVPAVQIRRSVLNLGNMILSYNPFLAPYTAAWVCAPFIFLSGTLSYHLVYAPASFIWVYAPSIYLGFYAPTFRQLGLCTFICHWDYAPSFIIGTMHPPLSLGLRTLIYHWVYAPSFTIGFTHPHFVWLPPYSLGLCTPFLVVCLFKHLLFLAASLLSFSRIHVLGGPILACSCMGTTTL
jgi:hypothetical protein